MKKPQTFLVIFISIIFVSGILIWISRPFFSPANGSGETQTPIVNAGKLTILESSYDFGNISMAKGNVTHVYRVKNEDTNPVVITRVVTSCMCTQAVLNIDGKKSGPFGMPGHGIVPSVNETLAPGQEAQVEVTFDPAAHGPAGIGKIQRVVQMRTADGATHEIQFIAFVTP